MGTLVLLLVCFTTVLSAKETAAGEVSTQTGEDVYLQLLRRVENLELRDQQQQAEIDSLRGELNTEKQKTVELKGRLERLQKTFAEQCEKEDAKPIHVPDATQIQTEADVGTKLRESFRDVRSSIQAGSQPSRIRRHRDMPVIAFHATLTSDALHSGVHQSIAFDHVVTNIGAAYNPHVGSFVAPVAGVYVFHTTIQIEMRGYSHLSVVKNRIIVANLYVRGVESPYNSDSAMVVLHLNKGDDVMIQNNDADVAFDGNHYSMFSGFLLYQDNADETTIVG